MNDDTPRDETPLASADDGLLVDLAEAAFRLGLRHGIERRSPIDGHRLISAIAPHHPRHLFHRQKLRQVYGAGFDIAAGNQRLRMKGETT